jgi:hypothetical protein
MKRAATLILGLCLLGPSACARYGVRNDRARQYPKAQIELNQSRALVQDSLRRYLEGRGFNPNITQLQLGGISDFELDWVRDSSLEYFYIFSGKRVPHLSHWKGVFRITELGPRRSRLNVEIMELLYMGPRNAAGPVPELNGQWVEAPNTHLRGWLELRRFFSETYPRLPLPRELTSVQVPSLDFPPLSLQNFRPQSLQRSARPSSF